MKQRFGREINLYESVFSCGFNLKCNEFSPSAWLTWKAAFRFRLFLVIAVLLLAAVVGLPLLLKDDGTARGFTQILITYTLSVITALLGLSTLWLSCGTLARDIEECQIQVVATKPVARWQIWLGKWLGIVSLNAALLVLSGACVYGLLQWRATRLPAAEQEILRTQVLVARGVAQPPDYNAEIDARTEQLLQERLKQTQISGADLTLARRQIREQVKAYLSTGAAAVHSRMADPSGVCQKLLCTASRCSCA